MRISKKTGKNETNTVKFPYEFRKKQEKTPFKTPLKTLLKRKRFQRVGALFVRPPVGGEYLSRAPPGRRHLSSDRLEASQPRLEAPSLASLPHLPLSPPPLFLSPR